MTMTLTEANVTAVMNDVVISTQEPLAEIDGHVVRGVQYSYVLGDVEGHRQDITDMCMALPPNFMRTQSDAGNGDSMLNAIDRADAVRWTQDYLMVEQLFVLGMAIGLVGESWARDDWTTLPGSLPYYVVIDTDEPWSGAPTVPPDSASQ